jgi:hypothetical protein
MLDTIFDAADDLCGIDAGGAGEHVLPGMHRHDDFLQRGIAGALAEAIDGAFDLACPSHHGGEAVGHGQAQVVMAMYRPDHLVGIRDPFAQLVNPVRILLRNVVADGVRNVDGGRAFLDHRLDDAAQRKSRSERPASSQENSTSSIPLRANRTACRAATSTSSGAMRSFFSMWIGLVAMKVWMRPDFAGFDGIQRPCYVLVEGATQAGDRRILDRLGNGPDRIEIPVGRCREAGFDNIDTHALKLTGDPQLLFLGHGSAGTLFTVAQGGVENDQVFLGHA